VASRPASASKTQRFGLGLGLASISLSHFVINRTFFGQNRVKFGNFVNFSGNNLKSYVVNHYLALFHNYFWSRPRPRSSGLGLEVLASFNIIAGKADGLPNASQGRALGQMDPQR